MNETKSKIERSIELYKDQLRNIRTDIISLGLVDSIRVLYYGQPTPIGHIANTSRIDSGIIIEPYDASILKDIEQTLLQSKMECYVCSKTQVKIALPKIPGGQKEEISTLVRKLAEESRVAIRNIRKKYKQQLDGEKSKDERAKLEKQLQEMVDKGIEAVDNLTKEKLK